MFLANSFLSSKIRFRFLSIYSSKLTVKRTMRSLSSSKPKLIRGRVAIDGFKWTVVCILWVDGRVERLSREKALFVCCYMRSTQIPLWIVAVVTEGSYLLIGHLFGSHEENIQSLYYTWCGAPVAGIRQQQA